MTSKFSLTSYLVMASINLKCHVTHRVYYLLVLYLGYVLLFATGKIVTGLVSFQSYQPCGQGGIFGEFHTLAEVNICYNDVKYLLNSHHMASLGTQSTIFFYAMRLAEAK